MFGSTVVCKVLGLNYWGKSKLRGFLDSINLEQPVPVLSILSNAV